MTPRGGGGGLRRRLLAAFVLVAVPPFLVLAVSLTALVSRSFETNAANRLRAARETALAKIAALRRRAEIQVGAVAREDLPGALTPREGDRAVARELAQRRDLQALEIVDATGRVISSHHWPAGFGLEDVDGLFEGDPMLRVEKVAEGYGVGERLALMPGHAGVWHGTPVTVRGGPFVDGDFLVDLSALMGVDLALYDASRGRWIAPPSSPLSLWSGPALGSGPDDGEVVLGGSSYRWSTARLHRALWLVVASPRTELDAVRAQARRLTMGIAAAALLAALAAALVLSGRIARPVRELAEGARRVASGDLSGAVEVAASDEIGELARAFNAMTAELEASRERLLQAERVAAWREMARRLAHELKNPLFPIQLSIETLRRAFDQEASGSARNSGFATLFRESSDTILEELRSLRGIIEQFGGLARMPQPQLRPTDLNGVVDQVLALYQARAGGLRFERELGRDLPLVPADRDLLGRALGNLVANALEAMTDGGTLRIRTSAVGGAVALEVADSGPGLTEEQRTRLFTPYFTTKKGGTGLGLAIVQGIVSDHGGRIEVRSEAGQGTAFTLILPVSGPVREKL